MKRTKIKDILKDEKTDHKVNVKGWVRSFRNNQFIALNDGSCLGNPGPGGWAALLTMGEREKEISGAENPTTNNRMELQAVIGMCERCGKTPARSAVDAAQDQGCDRRLAVCHPRLIEAADLSPLQAL